VLQSRSLTSRPWLIGGAVLIVTAGITVPFFFVTRLAEQLAIAAVLSLAAGIAAGLLARRLQRWRADRLGEQHRAQEELAEADRKYRDLTDGLPLVTWVYGVGDRNDSRVVGPQIETMLGYAPKDWDGELLAKILHPDDRDRVLEEIASATEGGVPFESEYRVLGRNGEIVWLREHARTVSRRDGHPLFGVSFLVDIGERKRAEDECDRLVAAERVAVSETTERQGRLDLLREVADVATSSDYKAAIERVAELVVRDFGDWCLIDLAEEGSPLKRLAVARAEPGGGQAAEAPQQEPDEAVRSVVASGNPEVVPALGERSNGQEPGRFVAGINPSSLICVPLRARQRSIGAITVARIAPGRPYGADDLALVEDIAGRIALALDRARLYAEVEQRADAARVLAHVADGILLLDRSGVVRLWNPAAEGITAIRAGDIVGRSAADAIRGWQESVDSVPIAATPDPGHPEVVIPLETERGERWISIAGVQFFGGTVYAFRDLTDVRRLEELKATFIATASHELRTPLAAVYGAAQTLLRHDFALDEGGRDRFVSLIADESERLGRIVNEILLASQLDAGRLDLEAEPFDATELVDRVVEATRAYAPPGVHVEGRTPDDLPLVEADRDKVRQVLVNLVENAMKYSPDGGRVEIGVEPQEENVLFHVRDEGLGIPSDEQSRVFEKFYRVDPHMTRGVGGTGLGLYICNELVGRMGGHIWLESKAGEGSTFLFELPAAPSIATARPAELGTRSENVSS
jgi:two-component system phosphate regulon sensor histidine kinase PhoR